ncbi:MULTISPECIES: hypothetical protein [unclassified Streptomyces]|uniref:hypothetical protein n=1 Tax=unclassified Streptomyces TaxID=2593676 RepID=UPI0022542C67|nr:MULTISPECIES: hypothetical protein [unclassified Streptomyces]WSP53253.1 hypothetical protein OG306_01575 [Streptomyces sp. NBC_01241]WSU26063.1 hypothetical protein OG508_37680 [Streptomyces sp. NBC_01108]MCX4792065.1 hypothetical protein [Streptomyces sp. NBC_01221]MCX4800017.1 hypothetical protein [Streptomyces sp. NBC_01242]WSJ40590.1 hypothetical protein OG772_34660 [Streptomyces sp. NBC_01321]
MRAHEDVRESQESLRWNTRCVVVRGRRELSGHGEALRALHRITFQVRGIARTLADAVDDHRLGQMFLDRYAATLEAAGEAVACFANPGPAEGPAQDDARERLRRAIDDAAAWHTMMTGEIEQGTLTEPGAWHVYGSLMTDAERLLADLDRAPRPAGTWHDGQSSLVSKKLGWKARGYEGDGAVEQHQQGHSQDRGRAEVGSEPHR